MRILYLDLLVVVFLVAGCTLYDRNNPPVNIIQSPNSDRIRIDCRGEKKSMQSCIDAANETCQKGWLVYGFRNDDTGTLKSIKESQLETKNMAFLSSSGDQYSRDMYISCK